MPTATVNEEAKNVAKELERYARQYMAGAFATPLPADVEKALEEDRVIQWNKGNDRVVLYLIDAKRDLSRKDFTGQTYKIPAGSRVVQHLSATPGVRLPSLKDYDYVYAYVEDNNVVHQLRQAGFRQMAVKISAASEIVGVFGSKKAPQVRDRLEYPDYDDATLAELPIRVPEKLRKAVIKEVEAIEGWRDDYPYYNKDGSWAAVCLKGYKPEDPFWGVKPREMSKNWKAEHPEEAQLDTCDWTVLTKKTPALMDLLASIPWWENFERVRLLQMFSKKGKEGKLLRHTDITDRDAGTQDGELSRFHLPILSHPDARTVAWDLTGHQISMNLEPWHLYYLDQRKPHMVTVPPGVNRIHLVPDVITNDKVRAKIGASVA